jgi:phosphoribosylformimino-5-aminoimidazole carboxamide ribotide isomerase
MKNIYNDLMSEQKTNKLSQMRVSQGPIPAIDLQGGQAVRLYKGDYAKKTIYNDDPVGLAKNFEEIGAKYLHIVDLDGAKSGATDNFEIIKKIRQEVIIPIQVGGGIRNEETVAKYLDEVKINRVILGTAAIEDKAFLKNMVAKYNAGKIVVGVDVRNGKVATRGWLKDSGADYLKFIDELKRVGIKTVIVTDISKDGTLSGPNWEMYEKIKDMDIIVSGGVSCAKDIEKAKRYSGVIVGEAFYKSKIDLKEMLQ